MGGRGPDGATQYAQHVHYQMKDAHGRPITPETFWRDREVGHVNHTAATNTRTHAEVPHVGREGDRGADVRKLQESLNALGIRDERGRPLSPDGHFGAHTKEAVENFQRAHGLHADGIVGPRTTEALQKAQAHGVPRLDDASHPGHEIYRQAREGVHRLDAQHQRMPDHSSERLAASLTVAAHQEGLHRIDHVALNDDASRTYAVQGELQSPFKRVAEVDTQQAMATSVEESSRAWQQVAQQAPNAAHQQQQAQQQAAQALPGAGP
jgi:putative chitinase